ncbi:MAG: short-chain dehydrogenase [Phycisphaerae bacterium]|nr:short-chain dehydrogenase [Phycisphaerae bacterium]HAW95208.1 short-chain dehydrogenase [Phycisphaerales bacterium]
MKIDFRLDGRSAVVCGATGGIGQAIAVAFADAGARVTVVGRDPERIDQTLSQLSGAGHDALCVNFSDIPAVEHAARARAEQGDVDILVNNTGGPAAGPASESDPELFLNAFQMHLLNAQTMVQTFLPGMKKNGFGRVINIISTSVITPIPGLGVSNTIRGAVANWGRTIAAELGPFGITVNNVLPGFTATARLTSLFEGKAGRLGKTAAEVEADAIATIPAGRIGHVEELAAAALFLASPAGGYVNGVNLPVDGGRVCKG